jgi:hypothetical protein
MSFWLSVNVKSKLTRVKTVFQFSAPLLYPKAGVPSTQSISIVHCL